MSSRSHLLSRAPSRGTCPSPVSSSSYSAAPSLAPVLNLMLLLPLLTFSLLLTLALTLLALCPPLAPLLLNAVLSLPSSLNLALTYAIISPLSSPRPPLPFHPPTLEHSRCPLHALSRPKASHPAPKYSPRKAEQQISCENGVARALDALGTEPLEHVASAAARVPTANRAVPALPQSTTTALVPLTALNGGVGSGISASSVAGAVAAAVAGSLTPQQARLMCGYMDAPMAEDGGDRKIEGLALLHRCVEYRHKAARVRHADFAEDACHVCFF